MHAFAYMLYGAPEGLGFRRVVNKLTKRLRACERKGDVWKNARDAVLPVEGKSAWASQLRANLD